MTIKHVWMIAAIALAAWLASWNLPSVIQYRQMIETYGDRK